MPRMIKTANGVEYRHTVTMQLHREDGPAIIHANGHEEWIQNGQRHRPDGPAIIGVNGIKEWYQNGKLHRIDGQAIEIPEGFSARHWNFNNWWLEGIVYDFNEWLELTPISDEDKTLLKLEHG